MSNSNNIEKSFQLHHIDNDAVDMVSDELSDSSCELSDSSCESIYDIEDKHTLSQVSPYDNNDIQEAKRLGMSLEDLFKMYQEINKYVCNEPEDTSEWPFDYNDLGYYDEGMEESYYG